jgi:hypothetical protein
MFPPVELDENFYLHCEKKFKMMKMVMNENLIKNECPIYYFLRDKNTTSPYFEGQGYFGKFVKIPSQEELIVTSFRGKTNGLVRINHEINSDSHEFSSKPNIHIFLLDGMSRTQFHRMMDKTGKSIQDIHLDESIKYSFIEYFKFHSVDYSSNSNMTPLMTGIDWWKFCRHKWLCHFSKHIPFE